MADSVYRNAEAWIDSIQENRGAIGDYVVSFSVKHADGTLVGGLNGSARRAAIHQEIVLVLQTYGPQAAFGMPVLIDAHVIPNVPLYDITAIRATNLTRDFIKRTAPAVLSSSGLKIERGTLVNMLDLDVVKNPLRPDVSFAGLAMMSKLSSEAAAESGPGDYIVCIECDGVEKFYLVATPHVDASVMGLWRSSHNVVFQRMWELPREARQVEFYHITEARIGGLRVVVPSEQPEAPGAMSPPPPEVLVEPYYDKLPADVQKVELLDVVDGDTLRVRRPDTSETFRIRLTGIDAYTLENEGGRPAYAYLKAVLGGSKFVYFREDSINSPDVYGRRVGEVWVLTGEGGRYMNLGPLMLANGYAVVYGRGKEWKSSVADYAEYKRWEEQYRAKTREEQYLYAESGPREAVLSLSAGLDDRDRVLGSLPEYGLRIGDCQFRVPPSSIRVSRRPKNASLPLLRSKSAIKKTSGHSDVVIELDLFFSSPEEINGYRVLATDVAGRPAYFDTDTGSKTKYYYVNGLRPLIAQFKRTPFLPIENELLNKVHGIHSVTLSSLVVNTVPGRPGALSAKLTMLQFSHDAYMPDAESLAERIVWPLFRDYYQGALADRKDMPPVIEPDGKTRLWSVPSEGYDNSIAFLRPTEESVKNIMWSSLTLSQMQWVDSGHDPTTSFGKRYADSKLVAEAVKQKRKWDEVAHDRLAYFEALGVDWLELSDVYAPKKVWEHYYQKVYFWPAVLLKQRPFGACPMPRSIPDMPCDLFILKLLSPESQKLAHRVYMSDGTSTDYFAIPAYRTDVLNTIASFEAEEFKTTVEEQVQRGEQLLVFEEESIDNLIPVSMTVAYNNLVTSLQLQGQEAPAHQYLGSQETYARITFRTTSRDAVARLRALHEYSQRLSRTYRVGVESGFLRIKSHLAQLFGMDAVVIESCTTNTEPGCFVVELVLSGFDRTQRDVEALRHDTSTKSQYEYMTHGNASSMMHQEYLRMEAKWRRLSPYPDLELPTYAHVNAVLKAVGIAQRLKPVHGDYSAPVDPDFYVMYTGTLKRQVHELLSSELRMELTDGVGGSAEMTTQSLADIIGRLAPDKSTSQQADLIASGGEARYEAAVDNTPVIVGPTKAEAELLKTDLKWETAKGYILPYRAYDGRSRTSRGKLHKSYHTAKCASLPVGTVIWVKALADSRRFPNGGIYVIEDNALDDPEYAATKTMAEGVHRIGIFYSEIEGDSYPDVKEPGWFERLVDWFRDVVGVADRLGMRQVRVNGKNVSVPIVEIAILGRINLSDNPGHDECREWIERMWGGAPDERRSLSDELAPEPNYDDPSLAVSGMLHDMFQYDCRGRLIRAFPTYQLFFVDEGRWVSWWRLFDAFYGLNAVSSVDIYRSRKAVADTCTIELSNVYGNITTFEFDEDSDDQLPFVKVVAATIGVLSPSDPVVLELMQEREAGKHQLFMRPGARIHLRMGYAGNVADLPILFNGVIAEMTTGDVVRIVAQGDGVELMAPVQATGTKTFEPRNKIAEMLCGDMTPAQKILFGGTEGLIDLRKYNIVHFGHPDFQLNSITYRVRELIQNVYPGHGLQKWTELPETFEEVLAAFIQALDLRLPYDEINLGLRMDDKTIWDVIQTCAGVVPDYIASVVPFELRSTLFYGRPFWPYTWRYNENGIAVKKPFWQFHMYHSMTDILSNEIRASADGVFTNVHLRYNMRGGRGVQGASVTVHADTDIYPEEQKTMVVVSDLQIEVPFVRRIPIVNSFINQYCAFPAPTAYAQSILANSLRDMYKGPLLVLGDPTVKPHDPIYIFDTYTQMYGLAQVKEVVHHFSQQTGFVTAVVPDCCVAALEQTIPRAWGVLSALGSIAGSWIVCSYFARKLVQRSLGERILVAASRRAGTSAIAALVKSILGAAKADVAAIVARIQAQLGSLQVSKTIANSAAREAVETTVGRLAASAVAKSILKNAVLLAFYVTTRSIIDYYYRRLMNRQSVLIAPLRVAGREFSAGINGSKGAVVGSTAGPVDKMLEKMLGWAGVSFEHKGIPILEAADTVVPDPTATFDIEYVEGEESHTESVSITYRFSDARMASSQYSSRPKVREYSSQDETELAKVVWGEAEGEPYEGKVAVAAVVLNRVASGRFQSTIQKVIHAKGQFDCLRAGTYDRTRSRFDVAGPGMPNWDDCLKAAREALAGNDPTGGAVYFYNPNETDNAWIRSRRVIKRIGNHVFAVD